MKPVVTFGDPERLVVDHLTAVVDGSIPEPTVGIGTPPAGWVATDTAPHLQVSWDGTPAAEWPVVQKATIRVTAHAASPTTAKRVAGLAQALLLAGGWPAGISSIRYLTGILPAQDPDTLAELASFTVQVSYRSTLA